MGQLKIIVSGNRGCGKTSVLKMLMEDLKARGFSLGNIDSSDIAGESVETNFNPAINYFMPGQKETPEKSIAELRLELERHIILGIRSAMNSGNISSTAALLDAYSRYINRPGY